MISPRDTILDTVARHPGTTAVFRDYGHRVGACILCEALFESIEDAAVRYGIDLAALLKDLEAAAEEPADTKADRL